MVDHLMISFNILWQ